MFNPLFLRPMILNPFSMIDFQQRNVRLQLRINRRLRQYRAEKAKREMEASKRKLRLLTCAAKDLKTAAENVGEGKSDK